MCGLDCLTSGLDCLKSSLDCLTRSLDGGRGHRDDARVAELGQEAHLAHEVVPHLLILQGYEPSYGLDWLTCGLDCLTYGLDCLRYGLDCLTRSLDGGRGHRDDARVAELGQEAHLAHKVVSHLLVFQPERERVCERERECVCACVRERESDRARSRE
jgi:hypothetical protein